MKVDHQSKELQQHLPPVETPKAPESDNDYLPLIKVSVDKLPSKGLPYPAKSFIKHRPFTFGEIKKVSQSKLDNKEKFEFLLSGIDCSFDKYDLTISDLLYIGFLRKISTLGTSQGIITVKCPKCKKDHREMIELGSMKSKIEFDDIKAPALPVVVEMSNSKDYTFSPLTVKKLFLLMDQKRDIDDPILLMAAQCTDHDLDDVYKFIENVYPEDGMLLSEIDELLFHGLKPYQMVCKNMDADKNQCGQEMSVGLDGGDALLMPFRGDKESTKSRIHFGSKTKHKSNPSK